jgi:hypothetical protein
MSFIAEVIISAYVNDAIVRPYIGYLLVGILICHFVRIFANTPVLSAAFALLAFANVIE